jgi:hypothetical protein
MSAAVGKDIESQCAKCGDVWHVVVAKVGESIVKVQCKECGAYHRYRSGNGKPEKRAPAAARAPRSTKEPVERFEAPRVPVDLTRQTRRYSASETFEIGDRVEHPTFGQGVVESSGDPGKITVFFPVGRKVLVHKKAAESASSGLEKPKPFDYVNTSAGGKPVGDR